MDDNKTGTSPLELATPSYDTSVEEILNETHRLIDLASPDESPARLEALAQLEAQAQK
jgi:hypothetical protein